MSAHSGASLLTWVILLHEPCPPQGTSGAKWRSNWKWSLTAARAARSLNDVGSTWITGRPHADDERRLGQMTAARALLWDSGVTVMFCSNVLQGGRRDGKGDLLSKMKATAQMWWNKSAKVGRGKSNFCWIICYKICKGHLKCNMLVEKTNLCLQPG